MNATLTSPYLREERYDADRIHAFVEAASPPVRAKVRQYPLTGEQAGAFHALLEHGSGDFLWSNPSTTQRLLEALANKGLAIRGTTTDRWGRERATYRPEPGAHAAFHERRRALERERHEAREREAQERAAKVAAARAALDADVETLRTALALLRPEHGVTDAQVASARARLDGMRQTSDFFLPVG